MALRYEDDFDRLMRYAQRPEQYDWQQPYEMQYTAKRFAIYQPIGGLGDYVLVEHFSNGTKREIGRDENYAWIKEIRKRKELAKGDTILLDPGITPQSFYHPAAVSEPEFTSQTEQTEQSNPRRSLQMNHSLAVFLVAPERVRAVKCAYELNDKGQPVNTYIFKSVLTDLAPGDIVVVPTDTRVKFTCVQVVETEVELDLNSTIEYKWIVAKLDRSEYQKVLTMETSMIDKIKRSEVRKARKAVADALFEDQEELRLQLEAEAKIIGHESGPQLSDPSTSSAGGVNSAS